MLFNILVFLLQAWNINASHATCESDLGYIFAFGDSYTTIGFNISGTQPSESNPIGNPTDDHATSAAGPIWVEYLTFTFNNSLILTYDFAVSGAAINDSLINQITVQYEPKYSTSTFWNDTDSIFMVWIGINDITQLSLLYSNDMDWNQTLLPRFNQYFQLMDNLYDTGARKFFLVNMPPLDRTPMILNHTGDIIENFRLGVDVFNNDLLPEYSQWFRGNHSDSQMLVYDAHSVFDTVLDNAQAYGYINNTCMNTTSCFWWNDYHPETSFHRILAQDMTSSLTELGWCSGGESAIDL